MRHDLPAMGSERAEGVPVYLGLGSNLGDRVGNIREALRRLEGQVHIEVVSSLYETEPVGYRAQPLFINAACKARTRLAPLPLLHFVKDIERGMGRKETFRWGPRVIDIDILFYDDLVMKTPELVIPHPHLEERAFVLVPLAEIAPRLRHPVSGFTVKELLERLPRREGVVKLRGAGR